MGTLIAFLVERILSEMGVSSFSSFNRVLFGLIFLLPPSLQAAEIIVASDSELQAAAASAAAGDTVHVKAKETPYSTGFDVRNSGLAGSWIVFRAEPGTIIDGQGVGKGISVSGKRYVRIEGFAIRNVVGGGIEVQGINGSTVQGNTSDIQIVGNDIYNTGDSGISVWGMGWYNDPAQCQYNCVRNVVVADNVIEKTNSRCISGGGYNEAITIASGVRSVIISRNTLRHNRIFYSDGSRAHDPTRACDWRTDWDYLGGGEGIDLKEGVADAYIFENEVYDYDKYMVYFDAGGSTLKYPQTYKSTPGSLRNIYFFNNKIHDGLGHGVGIVSEGSGEIDGLFIFNNIVYNLRHDGIILYNWLRDNGYPALRPLCENVQIFHNLIYNSNYALNPLYGGIDVSHDFVNNARIFNNISFSNFHTQVRDRFDRKTSVQIENNVMVDPVLVSLSSYDFHLSSSSASVIDNAIAAPVLLLNDKLFAFDFDFDRKLRDTAADIGPFEYAGLGGISAFLAELNSMMNQPSAPSPTPAFSPTPPPPPVPTPAQTHTGTCIDAC